MGARIVSTIRHRRPGAVIVAIVAVAGASYGVALKTSLIDTASQQPASSASNRSLEATQQAKPSAEQQAAKPSSGTSSVNATIRSTTGAAAQADVTVDGQHINVPDNGSVHKDISSSTGNTSVDISHTTSSSANNGGANINLDITTQSFISGSNDST
jgi:hypothetical protein